VWIEQGLSTDLLPPLCLILFAIKNQRLKQIVHRLGFSALRGWIRYYQQVKSSIGLGPTKVQQKVRGERIAQAPRVWILGPAGPALPIAFTYRYHKNRSMDGHSRELQQIGLDP
jgi:hypothetical protein